VKLEHTPIVDIGCGTGLLGKALQSKALTIDGIDISDAMLTDSQKTGLYRNLLNVDLTGSFDQIGDKYGAILSSGTFTHGHLGPTVLVRLLDIAKPDALFVIAINSAHYGSKGFESVIHMLLNERRIVKVMSEQVHIYQQTNHAHSADMGLIVSFLAA